MLSCGCIALAYIAHQIHKLKDILIATNILYGSRSDSIQIPSGVEDTREDCRAVHNQYRMVPYHSPILDDPCHELFQKLGRP